MDKYSDKLLIDSPYPDFFVSILSAQLSVSGHLYISTHDANSPLSSCLLPLYLNISFACSFSYASKAENETS